MKKRIKIIVYRLRHVIPAFVFVLFVYWLHSIPRQLFEDDYSTVVLDQNGQLLFAQIAEDGQWRFPQGDSIPQKYKTCLLAFEDRGFYNHWGISFKGIGRALLQNIKNGRVVSGGSTITMQLMRMSQGNDQRSISNKFHEIIMATRIEFMLDKDEILEKYAAHVPMGGNVVGIEAAAWRYFGKSPHDLSWAECATLAVLPNAPTLMHPGKNRDALKNKRNRLLKYLKKSDQIDEMTYELSIVEPLPQKPLPLPQKAIHLLPEAIKNETDGKPLKSTLDADLQDKISELLWRHYDRLAANEIHNAAVLVMEIETGQVVAYCGNIPYINDQYNSDVDNIQAPRSSGSILKPFLFAQALDQGIITQKSLLEDIPSYYGGYQPENYDKGFDGLINADEALQRSLNVPFVRLLYKMGVVNFLHLLKEMNFSTIDQSSEHYGLSLILGGAEVTLWDLVSIYRVMARKLQHENETYSSYVFINKASTSYKMPLSKGAIWQTLNAMVEVPRPGEELLWEQFSSAQKVAWKTGTSFGFRDAWSVGLNGEYVVGVWVGNADGEGRPGIVGRQAAAPILFDVFNELPNAKWLKKPEGLVPIEVCKQSGYPASDACPQKRSEYTPYTHERLKKCPYHKEIYLSKDKEYRIFKDCFTGEWTSRSFFVVSPLIESFYKFKSPDYEAIPQYHEDCIDHAEQDVMEWVYPRKGSEIYVPVNFEEKKERAVFEVSHLQKTSLYWHIDDQFIGITEGIHQMEVNPRPGDHRVSVIDEEGNQISRNFSVLVKNESH